MRIVSAGGTEVCSHCTHARTPLRRLRGLLGRPALEPGAGLLLEPCASVHTLMLRHAIDVVFLDGAGVILRVVPALRPWRHASSGGARSVLELPPGTCARLNVGPGDLLLRRPEPPRWSRTGSQTTLYLRQRGERRGVNGIQGFSKSRRMRRGAVAAACLVAAAASAASLSACGSDTKDQASAAAAAPPIQRGDMVIVSLDRSRPQTYGNAAVVPAADPRATRRLSALKCKRVAFAGGTGICLEERLPAKAVPTFQATFFDAQQHVTGSVAIPGNPSRARVSSGGRYAAATTFVSGDSYAPESKFTTRTFIFDPRDARTLANLEEFTVEKDGQRITGKDFNYWGVTFDGDSGRFYATLATGPHHYLIKGDVTTKHATVVRDGVECPSLSPDGTKIAFKARVGTPWQWRFHVLDLKTGKVTPLPEQRSVDDQIEWLDEQHLVYDRDEVVMQVAADGKSAPQEFLPSANSPGLVR